MKFVYSLREIAEQKKLDIAERDVLWAKLAEEAGGGEKGQKVADAFKKYYSMFDSSLVDWYVFLYDKGHGAFYTSSVGRDTEGFLPDVESTVQILRGLETTGIFQKFGNSWKKGLPVWMQQQMVYYAKSIQEPNGFFYYANWAQETADELISRRARDVGWCTGIITELGEKPMYDAPNGVEGGGCDPDEYWAKLGVDCPPPAGAKALWDKKVNERKNVSAASQEASEARAKASVAYLASHTAFADYVDERLVPGMKKNPYFYGNEVGETWRQVANANKKTGKYQYKPEDGEKYAKLDGMLLSDILISKLDDAINPTTGLWGDLTPERPTGKEFLYTNGFMKGMAAYNGLKYPYPSKYLETVANTLMDSLLGDEPSTGNICEVYNSWTSVVRLRENLQFVKDEAVKSKVMDTFRNILIEKAPEAVLNSFEKIKGYKKPDGGMAHSYYWGTPDHQGLPISTRANVGDVDATSIGGSGIVRTMFEALNLTRVPLFMHSDYMRFINILESLPPVTKTKFLNPLVDFEDGRTGVLFPRDGAKASVVPYDGSNALLAKFSANGQSLGCSYTAHSWDGDFYLFDSKMAVCAEDGAKLRIDLLNSTKIAPIYLNVKVEGGCVYVGSESYGMADYAYCAKVGEPFTLRLEYTSPELPAIRSELAVYINGKSADTAINSDTADKLHPAGYPQRALRSLSIISECDSECSVYLDDVQYYYAKAN